MPVVVVFVIVIVVFAVMGVIVMFLSLFVIVVVVVVLIVSCGMVVVRPGFQQADTVAHVNGHDIGTVIFEVTFDIVDPRLKSIHAMKEYLCVVDVFANSWPWLPAVSVLADGDEQVGFGGISSDVRGDISKDEKRCLGRCPVYTASPVPQTTGKCSESGYSSYR
jgi:hypothetical protein